MADPLVFPLNSKISEFFLSAGKLIESLLRVVKMHELRE